MGHGSKLNHQETAGFTPFWLPAFALQPNKRVDRSAMDLAGVLKYGSLSQEKTKSWKDRRSAPPCPGLFIRVSCREMEGARSEGSRRKQDLWTPKTGNAWLHAQVVEKPFGKRLGCFCPADRRKAMLESAAPPHSVKQERSAATVHELHVLYSPWGPGNQERRCGIGLQVARKTRRSSDFQCPVAEA